MKHFDHIIVGTGQASGTLLGKLIPSGESIAVIEGNEVGGSCVNYGCTPTKTLVATARAVHQARRGDFFGFSTQGIELNFNRVMERMNEVRLAAREGLTNWMEESDNVTLIRGWASFTRSKELKVSEQYLSGEKIYLNTGTRPVPPPVEGLEEVPWLDSAGLLALKSLPEHLIIIGGGYVGLEFAQVFHRFGSRVTVIQRGSQLMPQEDGDVAQAIRDFLEEEGITIYCNALPKQVTKVESGIRVMVQLPEEVLEIGGSHLLVAAGRKPNSDQLNLERAGIEIDNKGFIITDNHCRTNVEGVFGVGDVNGKGAFTHTAVNDAEIVLNYLFGDGTRKISDRNTIYSLFTDPPLGRVGLTEKEAIQKGYRLLKGVRDMKDISRAKEMGETNGFAKLLVDADTDMILGAAILGPSGDEVINMFAAIMHSQIPCHDYRKVVLVHPTVSELMPFVLDNLELVE